MLIFCLACGQTYETQSIEVAPPSPNIVGIGGFQQLTVTAHFSNGKTQDVTNRATYSLTLPTGAPLAPANALTISASGRVQVVDAACTWMTFLSSDTPPVKTFATSPYVLTATWDNHQSVSFISVASAAGCDNPDATGGIIPAPITFDVASPYRFMLNSDGTLRR